MALIAATKMSEGYGAVAFVVPANTATFDRYEIEVQVHPAKVNIYLNISNPFANGEGYHARRATLTHPEAVTLAAAVVNGECWLDVLADYVDENGAATCDHDFDLARLLRKAS